MKDLLKLPRPEGDRSYEIKKLETHYGTEYGMPSTHTMAGFLPLTVFLRLFKRGFSVPALVWVACIWHILSVALSRLYMGVHSIVDLLSGAVLAALCTYAIHSAGDSLDEFLYLSPESIYLWIMLISFFIVHYPSTEPWSASTCTACQIFGLTAGLGTAVWYSHTYFPKSWEILLENSVLKTIEGGTTFHAITLLLRVLSASVVTLIVKTLSKMVLNPICLTIFKRYFYGTYNPKLMKDSSGNEIAIEKLYPVEISVRYVESIGNIYNLIFC